MEKKNTMKAVARRLGATFMALVLLVAAITPAGEAFASEFDFGGGIFDAVKSVEETQPAQQSEAPEFDFGGGKEVAEEELPVYVPAATEPPVTETDKMESVGDTAETLNAADVTVEQGSSFRYTLSNANNYRYRVTPSVDGLTFSGNYQGYVTVAATESTPAGTYTVEYGTVGMFGWFSKVGEFTVEVTAPETDEDEGGSDIGTPEIEETQKMTMEKVATEILENGKPTGKYDLSLSLSGSIGSQTNKAKVDVIFIVDNSNSMYDSNRYMQSLRPAMQALIDNLSTTNSEKIDARYAIAMFGTNSEIRQNFTDAATARARVGNITQYSDSDDGGTNYEAGIYQGKILLNSVREGATSIVIFVTDGKPTFRGAPNKTGGNGQNDDEWRNEGANIEAAVNQISSMNCNYFYCIGIGNNFTNSSTEEYQNMQSLTGAVNADTTGIHSVSSTNVSGLTDVFNNISAEVTSFLCSNVTITDTLSNVEGQLMVQVSDPSSVKVEVITPEKTYGPEASVTLPKTESNDETTLNAVYENGVLKLKFPEAYKLEAGYTYKLHAVIEPTEKAYEEYRKTGYTDTGDAGTGTHAGQKGFYCNESATVTYDYQDKKDQVAYYSHPVIQLHPGTLVINKKVENMDVELMEALEFLVSLEVPGHEAEEITQLLTAMTYDETTGTYSMVFDSLSPDTVYAVTETGGEVAGYSYATTVNGNSGKEAEGTIGLGETVTLNYVNTYSQTDEDLEEGEGTISIRGEKLWDDNDNASQLRPESISVKLQGFDGTNWVDIQTVEVTPDTEGKWEFSVDVSSYAYLEYRFEETVPEYYEVIYQQPTYEFEYPAAGEWKNETSCSELNISSSIDAKTVIVSKKGSDYVIWSYDALTPGEQKLIMDSFNQVDNSFKPANTTFFYGVGSSVLGMTVTADKITYLNPNKWSYVYVGTYSRGSESATSGTITNKLASTDVTVTKDVSGNLGDRSLNFQFIATLSSGAFASGEGYTVSDDGKSVTFDLKHAESVVLKNVPLGADLTIVEENSGYSVTVKVGETEYQNGDPIKVVPDMQIDFFNHLSEGVDTGISLDSVPYIMMLVLAGAAFFFVMLRKRMAYED